MPLRIVDRSPRDGATGGRLRLRRLRRRRRAAVASSSSATASPRRTTSRLRSRRWRPRRRPVVADRGARRRSLEEHWRSRAARDALDEARGTRSCCSRDRPRSRRAGLICALGRCAADARARGAQPAPRRLAGGGARVGAPRRHHVPRGGRRGAVRRCWSPRPGVRPGATRTAPLRPRRLHPSELGTALAALVVYAGLNGASPHELRRRSPGRRRISCAKPRRGAGRARRATG